MTYSVGDEIWENADKTQFYRIVDPLPSKPEHNFVCKLISILEGPVNDYELYRGLESLSLFDLEVHVDVFGIRYLKNEEPPEIPKIIGVQECSCSSRQLFEGGCICGAIEPYKPSY